VLHCQGGGGPECFTSNRQVRRLKQNKTKQNRSKTKPYSTKSRGMHLETFVADASLICACWKQEQRRRKMK